MERKYLVKIIIILILSALILAGLAYLHFSDPSPKPSVPDSQEVTPAPTDETVTEEPETAVPETPETVSGGEWLKNRIQSLKEFAETARQAAPQPEETPQIPEETAPPVFDYWNDDSIQKLINRDNPVGSDYVPADLVKVSNVSSDFDEYLRQEAADSLAAMFWQAENDGVPLLLIDGYRSYSEQRSLYYTYLEKYGSATVRTMDAHPGASEHQLGLAVDLGDRLRSCNLRGCFADTSAANWLREHAWEYGWIERYPYGKTNITGINASPWHYRYVGYDMAKAITESGLTFEEYVERYH